MNSLRFACVGHPVEIACDDVAVLGLLAQNFSAMPPAAPAVDSRDSAAEPLAYRVEAEAAGAWRIRCAGSDRAARAVSTGDLVYALEADLVVRLQLVRPDLLFLHAAALAWDGSAVLLVGRSGAGKSTTCWGLLHHGFRYLSDEMAPIELADTTVLAYPHALCMKRDPPAGYPLPDRAWRTSRGVHVSIEGAMAHESRDPLPVRLVLLVEHDSATRTPRAEEVGAAEAAVRLYPNVLNALAHENGGLAAVAVLAAAVPVLRLDAGELRATCRLVQELVREQLSVD